MKMYLARDKDGSLYLFEEKPIKSINGWVQDYGDAMPIDFGAFPDVKWEDEEPTEVELVIKKK